MAKNQSWKIYWNEESYKTFLYGATIKFNKKDDVYYENDLISPGSIIKEWSSMTNYQMDRVEPSLPIIDGEKSVRVRVNIDSDVEGGVLLRFLFFQRNGKLEGSEIIRGDEAVILCPIRTYYYHVQLIAGGSHKIHFHDFTIEELED